MRTIGDQFVQLALEGADLVGFVCAYGARDPQWGSLVDNLHVAAASKRSGVGSSLMGQDGDLAVRHARGVLDAAGRWQEFVQGRLIAY